MQKILTTPAVRQARRSLAQGQPNPTAIDPRWHLLDLVRTCRQRLALRDRDIAVLRGLLSLLPGNSARWIVFASNRTLIDRCDGIDERTLRRRLVHLEGKGLVQRRLSPNGKRYQLRDETGAAQISYGIDLEPLRLIRRHLEALAEECAREAQRIALAKARIRDALFHAGPAIPCDLAEECRLSLRRALPSATLEALHDRLVGTIDAVAQPFHPAPLTASDSQNDRHIQSSEKESLNRRGKETPSAENDDLSVSECMDLAPSVRALAPDEPRSWRDILQLAAMLGPAIGLKPGLLREAEAQLTQHGAALAIIGLVQAFTRIRNPEAYLRTLIKSAREGGLNLCRMYRSLVKPSSEGFA